RRRVGGAGDRDRRADLGRDRAGRRSDPAADPGAAGDGGSAVRRRRDGDFPPAGRRLTSVQRDFEDLLRELAPQVLGVLARRTGDFAAAEDAVQESLLAAALRWPREGVPDNPRGWLLQTGSRRLIDQWRSDQSRRAREALAQEETPAVAGKDDTLAVLFMCCHPALTPASASATTLTLRAVGGLTTAEIARAYLVAEAAMAQRIARA